MFIHKNIIFKEDNFVKVWKSIFSLCHITFWAQDTSNICQIWTSNSKENHLKKTIKSYQKKEQQVKNIGHGNITGGGICVPPNNTITIIHKRVLEYIFVQILVQIRKIQKWSSASVQLMNDWVIVTLRLWKVPTKKGAAVADQAWHV